MAKTDIFQVILLLQVKQVILLWSQFGKGVDGLCKVNFISVQ